MYDERFKIVSDWEFFFKQALNSCRFEYITETVSCFDMNGVSSVNHDLVNQEREIVLNELLPEMLVQDFKAMDEMEAALNTNHVKKVLEFGGKKRLYHKMITGFFSFLKGLDGIIN